MNRIAQLRAEEGMSLRQLALKLDPTGQGPTETTVGRWERGDSGVPDRWKPILAELFGVSIIYLMGWETRPSEQPPGEDVAA